MNWNPFAWPFRAQYLFGFFLCAAFMAYAIYEQFEMNVEPCPMCIFQRLAFIGMGIFFLAGGLHAPGPKGRRVYASLVAISRAVPQPCAQVRLLQIPVPLGVHPERRALARLLAG